MGFVIFLHCLVSVLLMTVILMQSGRGGGLTEQFASAENIFGAKTNTFMVKATAVFAGLFIITCMSLAFLSSKAEQSLMSNRPPAQTPIGTPVPKAVVPADDATKAAQKSQETQPPVLPAGNVSQPANPGDAQKSQ